MEGALSLPGVRPLGATEIDSRLPVFSFDVEGVHPHDLCHVLNDHGVALRGGHHCAQPLLRALGVSTANRASIALYNNDTDIEMFRVGLEKALRVLR